MPRRKAKLELTLFPFLSVLSGLIAIMVLFMIVTVSTRVITSEAVRPPPPDPKAGGDGKPAPDRPEEDGIDTESYKRLEDQIKQLEGVLQQRLADRDKVGNQLRELAALVKVLQQERAVAAAAPRRGVRLGEPKQVEMILPQGANNGKKPVFIEVSSAGYVVYPEKTTYRPIGKKKGGGGEVLDVPQGLNTLLEELAQKDNKYPLLLVHPNGVEAFHNLHSHIMDVKDKYPKLDIGWEPFSREWLLVNK